MDKIDRFKKLCALKMGLESISRRCDDDKFEKWNIKNMIDGSLIHVLKALIEDSKIELDIPIEVLDELKGN